MLKMHKDSDEITVERDQVPLMEADGWVFGALPEAVEEVVPAEAVVEEVVPEETEEESRKLQL